jgi:hypothetical protein
MEGETPQFRHDCKGCVFLGRFRAPPAHAVDLYFCQQCDRMATVIARYGNEGLEYQSGLAFAEVIPELGEAKRRAVERGLLK